MLGVTVHQHPLFVRPIRPPHIVSYSSGGYSNEPGSQDDDGQGWPSVAGAGDGTGASRLHIRIMHSLKCIGEPLLRCLIVRLWGGNFEWCCATRDGAKKGRKGGVQRSLELKLTSTVGRGCYCLFFRGS